MLPYILYSTPFRNRVPVRTPSSPPVRCDADWNEGEKFVSLAAFHLLPAQDTNKHDLPFSCARQLESARFQKIIRTLNYVCIEWKPTMSDIWTLFNLRLHLRRTLLNIWFFGNRTFGVGRAGLVPSRLDRCMLTATLFHSHFSLSIHSCLTSLAILSLNKFGLLPFLLRAWLHSSEPGKVSKLTLELGGGLKAFPELSLNYMYVSIYGIAKG